MFEFRKIELSDMAEVKKRLAVSDRQGCEYCFANNCAWQRLNDSLICFHDDFYISQGISEGKPYVVFPTGVKKDSEGRRKYILLFDELEVYYRTQGYKLILTSVMKEDIPWLREVYGDRLSIFMDDCSSDYIYDTRELISLKGKKFHGKRNHIKRFMENDWSFEVMTEDMLDECVLFTAESYNRNGDDQGSAAIEQYAIHFFLMNMQTLGLKGGILRMNGEIVGLSVGEAINSDTFGVHIEKARADVNGAYPMLCNQFVKRFASDYRYVNREEDLGIEGLRRSKRSYHPEYMLDKYIVCFE